MSNNRHTKPKHHRRLRVEALEDRRLLAILTVQNNLDGTLANLAGDGELSLREAIAIANIPGTVIDGFVSNDVEDDIVFDPAVFTGGDASLIRLHGVELEITETLTIDASVAGGVTITGDANDDDVTDENHITDVDASSPTQIFPPFDDQLDDNVRLMNFSASSGSLTLLYVTLTGGYTDDNGGAVRFDSTATLSIHRSTISGNRGAQGGGIYSGAGSVFVSHSVLASNRASKSSSGHGGGISTASGGIIVSSSDIIGNRANGIVDVRGGGIHSESGDVRILSSLISGNGSRDGSFGSRGGGVAVGIGNLTVIGSNIRENYSGSDFDFGTAGGAYVEYGSITIDGSTISENASSSSAGGIMLGFGSITVTDSTISGNTSGAAGGGIAIYQGMATLIRTTVSENSNNSLGSCGGGIFHRSGSLELFDSTVSGNLSGKCGGGIFSDSGSVTLTNSTISGNTNGFNSDGGGIYSDSGVVTLVSSTVYGNVSERDGGGIFADFGAITLTDSVVTENVSRRRGGGIATSSASVLLHNSIVGDNRTERIFADGGAIWTTSGSISLSDSSVERNTSAGSGGGLATETGSVSLERSRIVNNTALGITSPFTLAGIGWGGGMHVESGSIVLEASEVTGNVSDDHGGGISAIDGTVQLHKSTVSGNIALGDHALGGGIYTDSAQISLTESNVSNNRSGDHGGGIATRNGEIDVGRTTVTNNVAGTEGGGIFINTTLASPLLTLENSIVSANIDSGTGPDILPSRSSRLNINHSLIGDTTGSGIDETTGVGNLLNVDPLIGPLADNGGPTMTHALLPGSPALNAGDPSIPFLATETDQRGTGYSRVAFDRIDIGAYEAQVTPSADFNADGDVDGSDFLAWQRGFEIELAVRADGNSDDDTDVDASDLAAWAATYGDGVASEGAATGQPSAISSVLAVDAAVGALFANEPDASDDEYVPEQSLADFGTSARATDASVMVKADEATHAGRVNLQPAREEYRPGARSLSDAYLERVFD